MKRKNLSFMTLFMLTASLVGGCSCSKGNNENVSELVIKVGDKEYSAKELYNELLSTGTGANEAFAKVLRAVVESSVETHPNIQAAADLAAESFEEDVENDALANGTSKDESRKKLLEEKGYSSVDEMKADIIYEQKLTRITESYWEENKASYFDGYVEDRLPYLIRHVLVKIDDSNANKISNNVTVSKDDAKKLYDVIKRFENGDKFSYVANQESEDTGSTAKGGAYYMDMTSGANGFVDEFVYGTYAFDAYTTRVEESDTVKYVYGATDKVNKLKGLSDTDTFSKYYANGFNFVDMSVVNLLEKVYDQTSYSDKDYFQISAVNKVGEGTDITYETADGNINSTENYYARSIIFNRAFNKPGVSVIGYNKLSDIPEGVTNYVELKLSATESKYILTDENKQPIFFVAARGSSNAIWVHFLTINVSALDDLENAKKFFSLTPDEDDDSYVKLMNTAGTTQGANTVVAELESYVKSYATNGLGEKVGEESILKYDMVQYYLKENEIEFANDQLGEAIDSYITNKKYLLKKNLLNTISDDWDTHTDKLAYNMSELNVRGIKPFECAVLAGDVESINNPYNSLTTSDYLCRYVYGEGYQVQLNYNYKSSTTSDTYTKISTNTSNRVYFDDTSGYTQWVTIGAKNSNKIILPTPIVKDGYTFEGWFTDKSLEKEVSKDEDGYYIDLSESRITNSTIFFAKVSEITATTINYTYQYANGEEVGDDVVITNNNATSRVYTTEGDNTITLSTSSVSSNSVEAVSFKDANGNPIEEIELTLSDKGQTKEIIVVVAPKATRVVYRAVTVDGSDVAKSFENPTNTPSTTYTYNPDGTNTITFSEGDFEWASAVGTVEIVRFEIARDGANYNDSNNKNDVLTLTEKDMNKEIIVYVVVEVQAVQGGQA